MTRLLIILCLLLTGSAFAADSRWGWDGGCAYCPEHISKHLLTEASWIRLGFAGDYIYSNKTATANWVEADLQVNGWSKLGIKIIFDSAFHPSGLTDAEIVPWMIEFNRQILARYGDKIVGIQPLNEPWFDDENIGSSNSWAYTNRRLGASHNPDSPFWLTYGGPGMASVNNIGPMATAWFLKMRDVLNGVHALAAPLGIKVYGPHWQTPNYVKETKVAAALGVLDGVDVFSFGCVASGEPDGPGGWATYVDDILPIIGGKPWACIEFHLNHAVSITNLPDCKRAGQIKSGMEHWRDMGVQCVLVHIGLQNWNTQLDNLSASLCGYANNQPEETLRVIQVALSKQNTALPPALIEKLDTIQRLVTPKLVPVIVP